MQAPISPTTGDGRKSDLYRKLSGRLDQLGLWMETDRFGILAGAQEALGEKLLHATLPASGIHIDIAYLQTSPGRSLRRFCTRLPRVLAFGYEISAGMHDFLRRIPRQDEECRGAILGAVFNGGISLFDRICDSRARASDELSALFDGGLLMRLSNDADTRIEVSDRAGYAGDPAVRVLLKIISDFFTTLDIFARHAPGTAPRQELNKLMMRAYAAEVRCSVSGEPRPEGRALLAACEEKSTLPFRIMLQLVRVCDGGTEEENPAAADELVRQLARSFWLLDDLVDLVADFHSGDVNEILLRAKDAASSGKASCEVDGFPAGIVIDATVDRACLSLQAAIESSGQTKFAGDILTYVRRWVTSLSRGA